MKNGSLLLAAALVAGVVLAGCSSSGGSSASAATVNLAIANMSFSQKELTVQKGHAVKLVLANKDSQLHDFSIDKIPAKVQAGHSDMHHMAGKMPDVHVAVDAGKTGEVTFTPSESGTYTFYCTVPGHKESGMQGQLLVE